MLPTLIMLCFVSQEIDLPAVSDSNDVSEDPLLLETDIKKEVNMTFFFIKDHEW